MNKRTYLAALRQGLAGFPPTDIEEWISFYGEMIDDRVEEGLSEEAAIAEIGDVQKVVSQILRETPLTKLVKERVKPQRRLRAWEIVLLILGSPIWLSLLIAAFAVVIALYATLWSVIVSVWAVEVSLAACALGGTLGGIVLAAVSGNVSLGLLLIGGALVCAGLSVLGFFGCKAATYGMARLTRALAIFIKSLFVRKERRA